VHLYDGSGEVVRLRAVLGRVVEALERATSHGFGACKCKAFDHCVVAINSDPETEAVLAEAKEALK
jgi:hypothetical protein